MNRLLAIIPLMFGILAPALITASGSSASLVQPETGTPTPIPAPSSTLLKPGATGDLEIAPLSTVTSGPAKLKSAFATPTRTPRPTPTVFIIIEPTDPRLLRSMLGLATVALVIILVGVWLIRHQE